MKMSLKKIIPVLAVTIILLGASFPVFAQTIPQPPGNEQDVWNTVTRVINFMRNVILFVAIVVILIAGYLYVTAGGDEEKTKTARNYILYAIIGIIVAFLAAGLVNLIKNQLVPGI